MKKLAAYLGVTLLFGLGALFLMGAGQQQNFPNGGGGGGGLPGSGTNPFVATSTLQLPLGSVSAPAVGNGTSTNSGFYFNSVGTPAVTSTGVEIAQFDTSNGGLLIGSTNLAMGSSLATTQDVFLSRQAAHVAQLGGTSGTSTAALKLAGVMSVGTTFTSNAGCGDTTLTGGATAGKYTSVTAGTCTTIITMGNSATAPNGWSCVATDLTTAGDAGNIHQTATAAATASFTEGTVAANDVIAFHCIGF